MHVAITFSKLITRLQPTPAGVFKARGHAQSIKGRLQASFRLNNHYFIGSFARQTAVNRHSDLDLLAVLPRDAVKWGNGWIGSDTLLRNVRDDLDDRFHATEVRRDGQAIVVNFGGGSEPVDVVPALFSEFKAGFKVPTFLIPDGAGGWMQTSPTNHTRYVNSANERSGGKLAKTIQLVKHWRSCREPAVPLASVYLDIVLASSDCCLGPKSYARCLYDAFVVLAKYEGAQLCDPTNSDCVLAPARTPAQTDRFLTALAHARDHAARALVADAGQDWREAMRQWGIVFNGDFG